MTILDEIAAYARRRVEQDKGLIAPEVMKEAAERAEPTRSFYDAAARPGVSLICEIKKASPSKGVIDMAFDYRGIAADYEAGGADCVSCLTEPKWFLGSDEIFREIRGEIRLPMLRKDFVVDPYQLYQARTMGADCALLICALMDAGQLAECLEICDGLGLDALTETHNEREIAEAVSAGARIIGINNRNLKDFSVDLENTARLRDLIPPGCLAVAESGVQTPGDAARMKAIGADAILMGETLMRAKDKRAALAAFREAVL